MPVVGDRNEQKKWLQFDCDLITLKHFLNSDTIWRAEEFIC